MRKLDTQFSFAGFSFPRYLVNLHKGNLYARLSNRKNSFTSGYYHAPIPDNKDGIGFYLTDNEGMGFSLRWKWCDDITSHINHTGWFCDEYQNSKIRGIVFRLPNNRGFIAGWSMGENMASSLDFHVYDSELDAAYAADSLAEKAAEDELEYQSNNQDED